MLINQTLAEMNGLSPAEHIGRTVREVIPELAPTVEPLLKEVLDSRAPRVEHVVSGETPAAPGVERHWRVTYYPLGIGERRLGGVVVDVTDAIRAERERADAHAALEATAKRLRDMQALSDAALANLSLDRLLVELLSRLRDALRVDTASFYVLDERRGILTVRASVGIEERIAAQVEVPFGEGLAGMIAAADGPVIVDDLPHSGVTPVSSWLSDKGVRSVLGVPLRVAGRTIGALHVTAFDVRNFSRDDASFLELAGERAALAFERARAYERRHRVADALQRALLPPELPPVPGVELAARFRPAGRGEEIGGDFYDVFETTAGAAVVIGDVCGKGADAAAVTALVRHTVRTAATRDPRPQAVLAVLNDALRRSVPDDRRLCTVLFGILEPTRDGVRFTFASGGHPLPIWLGSSGASEATGREGTLLGLSAHPRTPVTVLDMLRGDRLLLYTDGLTDANAPARILAPRDLLDALRECVDEDAAETARCIESTALRDVSEPRDDIALLVLHALGDSETFAAGELAA